MVIVTFPVDCALDLLEREVAGYEVPVVDLIATQTKDPFKVLVATILSARTRDEVTAVAARRLFACAQNPEELAMLSREEIENLIYPVGFFRNKATYLHKLPEKLAEKFDGQVPATMEELLQLPGVGRKTANLVLATAFGVPAICVDTHVHRIMNIWGYVATKSPLETEMALRDRLPRQYWLKVNRLLVAFGQGTCRPVSPHCDRCVLTHICPRLGVTPRRVPKISVIAASQMKLMSWNVNGLRAALGKGFLDVLSESNADVFALQEIKALPEQLPDTVKPPPGYHVYWNPAVRKGYSGTAVFSRREPEKVIYGLGNDEWDCEGRVITLEFEDYYLVNIYFPNAQPGLKRLDFKLRFNQAVMHHMDRLSEDKTVVLCGDLNVAHKEIDLANPAANTANPGFSPQERAWMDEVVAAGYIDTFRLFHEEPGNYTWWSYRFNARVKNIGWRIDYFLVDPASRDRVVAAEIHDDVTGSDHCPVSLVIS
ncbi:MAG: exodeoxyribonuclease III [Desulfobulbus propionicus]|nr:MAG: exodeoxyribonuclease III [Desulfobulbus propionicus]